ncbi:MAG: tetratricopeptide repeat protein [Cyclobacteriaceae bacterium]|nr:tetratricopeptide repeat protein [Cyclobacteriaceae bacterium]
MRNFNNNDISLFHRNKVVSFDAMRMNKLHFLFAFCVIALTCEAQYRNALPPEKLYQLIRETPYDSAKARLYLQLSSYYFHNSQYDSTLYYVNKTFALGDSAYRKEEALALLSSVRFIKNDYNGGVHAFDNIIQHYQQTKNKEQEANAWSELAATITWYYRGEHDYVEVDTMLNKSMRLYHQLGDEENEIKVLKQIADLHLNTGKLNLAERELLEVIDRYNNIGFKNLHYTYDLLAEVYKRKGNFEKGLVAALKSVDVMRSTGDSSKSITFYGRLADMYRELEKHEQSITWYKKAMAKWKMIPVVHFYVFHQARLLTDELIKVNRKEEALLFLLQLQKEKPPVDDVQKACMAQAFAHCYASLKQYSKAEFYYLDMVKRYSNVEKNNFAITEAKLDAGTFYIEQKQYTKARDYINEALAVSPDILGPTLVKDIHLKLYHVDSATGNYPSAIKHLKLYQLIKDSLFNETKSKQIEELQIQYETQQKDQNIKLLTQEKLLQQSEIKTNVTLRNLTLGVTVLLLIVMGLLFSRYRLKQRSNVALQANQKIINEKNETLQHLLTEKEWLLKEIHHRVKNNLQTVMSLLNSQSVFLKDNAAVRAIKDSQHRVNAMSLIHQKLYQTNNIGCIEMKEYIHDLVDYLKDGYQTTHHILFELDIDAIKLDVSQAVPIGLILNEAITNAIKYAFPSREGAIQVSLKLMNEQLELIIADNGIGLPVGFVESKSNSLGMSLMRGLSEDVDGTFSVENKNGTIIKIVFTPNPVNT